MAKKRKPAPVKITRDGKVSLVKASRFRAKRRRAPKSRYHKYLLSPEWKALRKKVFERDEYRCRFCESSKNLEVHHLTYERIFHERLEDLVTACDGCHGYIHRLRRASLPA